MGWTIWCSIPGRNKRFSLLQNVQTGSVARQTSYTMVTEGSVLGVTQLGCETDHPLSSSAKVQNEWSYTSAPTICLYVVDRETTSFTLASITV
jgi:hypothetical protein